MNKIKDIKITKKQILKGKNGNPSYDFYKLKIIYSNNTRKTITVFTEPNAIDINNHEQTKSFMINSLFGPNGLIKEQGRDDYIFLGRPTKDANGKTIPYRFYKIENSNKNAQEYFDEYVYPKLQNIFNSNKQTQTTSLYDEIKSPFDDINTIKKIIELYADIPPVGLDKIRDNEKLYNKITHSEPEEKKYREKYKEYFSYYIYFPTLSELYNNIKQGRNISELSDPQSQFVLKHFKSYKELYEYINENNAIDMWKKYKNYLIYNVDYKTLFSKSELEDETFSFKITTGQVHEKLYNRLDGGEKMGYHVSPQKLKSENMPLNSVNSEMKFYINAGYDTYKFSRYFQQKCKQYNINYYYKVVNPLRFEEDRSDKLCIYTEYENAENYLKIIKDIIKEHPEIKYRKPPITAGTIDGIIGVGSDAISNGGSYNEKMSEICRDVLEIFFNNKDKKDIMNYINKNPDLLYEIREKIIRKARELGLSEKICLSKDAVLQLTSNKSKRR